MTSVISVQVDDIPIFVDLLCRAFTDDPFYVWTMPDNRSWPDYFAATLRTAIRTGQAFTTDQHAGIAIWRAQHASAQRSAASELPARLVQAAAQLDQLRPPGLHSYLPVLATDPDARRQGIGRLLLNRPPADHQIGGPVYLEATTRQGYDFYKKVGFTLMQTIALSGGGPDLWLMQR